VITPRKHSLPNQRNAQGAVCLGKRNGSPESGPASPNDGKVCFYDFHVSLSITEVMALDIRFPKRHLNAKPLHIS
jgi:hypothetical protein